MIHLAALKFIINLKCAFLKFIFKESLEQVLC